MQKYPGSQIVIEELSRILGLVSPIGTNDVPFAHTWYIRSYSCACHDKNLLLCTKKK